LHKENPVLIFPDHLIKKTQTGAALAIYNTALAPAGIHHQAERQRQVRFPREIADRLWAAVFEQGKILPSEITDQHSGPVPDGRQNIDHFDIRREDRLFFPTPGKSKYPKSGPSPEDFASVTTIPHTIKLTKNLDAPEKERLHRTVEISPMGKFIKFQN
jgi:hypothetical protein